MICFSRMTLTHINRCTYTKSHTCFCTQFGVLLRRRMVWSILPGTAAYLISTFSPSFTLVTAYLTACLSLARTPTRIQQHRACPTGRAWFDEFAGFNSVHRFIHSFPTLISSTPHKPTCMQCSDGYECSNRGHCDVARGVCKCDAKFEGTACHRLKCPRIRRAGRGLLQGQSDESNEFLRTLTRLHLRAT